MSQLVNRKEAMQEEYSLLLNISQIEKLGFFEHEFKIFLGGYGLDPEYPGEIYKPSDGMNKYFIKDMAYRTLARRIKMIASHMKSSSMKEIFSKYAAHFTDPNFRYFILGNYGKVEFFKANFDSLVKISRGEKDFSKLDELYNRVMSLKGYNLKSVEKLIKSKYVPLDKSKYEKSDYIKFFYYMDELEKEIMAISVRNFKYRYSQVVCLNDQTLISDFEKEALAEAARRSSIITLRKEGDSGYKAFSKYARYFLLDILAKNDYNLNVESDQLSFIEDLKIFWRDNEIHTAESIAASNNAKVSCYGERPAINARIAYMKISPKLKFLGDIFPKFAIPKRENIKNTLLFFDKMFEDNPLYIEGK